MAIKADWVVAGGAIGEAGHCTRCGQGLTLGSQLIDVWVAAVKAFTKIHTNCTPHWTEPIPKTPGEWARGRDVGISAGTIYAAGTHSATPCGVYGVPHDPDDFARCYRLLKLFPELCKGLLRTVDLCKQWGPFVASWNELTVLYEREAWDALYARIKELEGGDGG